MKSVSPMHSTYTQRCWRLKGVLVFMLLIISKNIPLTFSSAITARSAFKWYFYHHLIHSLKELNSVFSLIYILKMQTNSLTYPIKRTK